MNFLRFLIRRVSSGLLVLAVFLFVTFLAVGYFIPGDAVSGFRLGMTEQQLEELRQQLGLDRALPIQFFFWLRALFEGNLGRSTFGVPLGTQLFDVSLRTAFVFVAGLAIAFVVGTWLGRRTGWKRRAGSDVTTLTSIVIGTAFPPFLAFMLTFFLRERSRFLSRWRSEVLGDGAQQALLNAELTDAQVLGRMTLTILIVGAVVLILFIVLNRHLRLRLGPGIGLVVVGAVSLTLWLTGAYRLQAIDLLFAATIPLLAFTMLSFGEFMLVGQTAIAAGVHEDYVEAARAKGLSARRIRDVHGGSNAKLVIMSRLAASIPFLLTGLVIIERAVDWPGVGDFLFRAVENQDMPTIMSSLLVVGVITIAVRIGLEILQFLLDPRLRRPGAAT